MKEIIKKELIEMAPNLSQIKKQNPFKVPEGYFEDFDIEGILINDGKGEIPEGYFDTLPKTIMDKIKSSEEIQPKKTLIKRLKPYTMGIAASFGLLIMSVILLNNNKETDSIFSSNEELIAYIELYDSEFGSDFYDLVDEEMIVVELDLDEIPEEDLNQYYDSIDTDDLDDLFDQ